MKAVRQPQHPPSSCSKAIVPKLTGGHAKNKTHESRSVERLQDTAKCFAWYVGADTCCSDRQSIQRFCTRMLSMCGSTTRLDHVYKA